MSVHTHLMKALSRADFKLEKALSAACSFAQAIEIAHSAADSGPPKAREKLDFGAQCVEITGHGADSWSRRRQARWSPR
jgi:hypothetical protein